MLYSTPEKIKHILSYYNIQSILYSFQIPGFDIILTNLVNGQTFHVFSYYPLYNILTYGSNKGNHKYPSNTDSIINDKYNPAIQHYYNLDTGSSNYLNEEEFKRFKTYRMKSYSEMEFGLYDNLTKFEDIENIFNLCGIRDAVPVKKFGDFIIDDSGNLRVQLYPNLIMDTEVDDCLFGEFQVYRINNFNYKILYVIYVKNNRPILYYHNSFLNKLSGFSDVNVDLISVFCDLDDMYDDFKNISKYNNEYFIVFNFLNFTLFKNTPDGIYRLTPNIFNKDFFKILNDNVGFNIYGYSASGLLSELSYTVGITSTTVDLTYRFIDWEILKDIGLFKDIPKVVTNAEDYNDAIFNLTSTVAPVLFLVK